ncbi:MAG: AsmA family protein [Treponema sp.]|nr:AsmA family protein [Treponema sp.]
MEKAVKITAISAVALAVLLIALFAVIPAALSNTAKAKPALRNCE